MNELDDGYYCMQQQQQQLYPTKTARPGLDTVKGPLREHTAT